jgi:hypothetical protein
MIKLKVYKGPFAGISGATQDRNVPRSRPNYVIMCRRDVRRALRKVLAETLKKTTESTGRPQSEAVFSEPGSQRVLVVPCVRRSEFLR